MEEFGNNFFTVLDPEDMKTLAFLISKTQEDEDNIYTLQKLDCSVKTDAEGVKKTFYFNDTISGEDKKDLVLLTVGNGKALINSATFETGKLSVEKKSNIVSYKKLFSSESAEYTDIKYTPNFKRPISIIDPELGDEVKPVLYYDSDANEVKAKIKMLPNKSYIAIEVRE
ncbi:MAG: hypothetical protein J6B87_01995 [Clostridia bacterium]|nr:hypothetical protein [Clostridia bacterium]